MKSSICLFGAVTLLAASAVSAQDDQMADSMEGAAPEAEESSSPQLPGGFLTTDYLGILGTYTHADKARSEGIADISQGIGLDVLYGHQFDDGKWGYEVHGFSDIFETEDALRTDFYRYGVGADLVYAFSDRTKFTPFLLAGGGGTYNDIYPSGAEDDGISWFANAGGGFVTAPMTNVGFLRIRGEIRYVYDGFADGYGDIRGGLGIEIPLLKGSAPVAAPINTETVKIVEVSTGLLDSDGDGVVDEKDKCPDTPAGTRVDGEGCALEKIIALNGVTFEFNEARLRPDAVTILDTATEILKRYPDMNVEVAGHTDNIGTDEYNQNLSEMRASAVRDYFVEHGIPTGQMTVKGYGEAEPVADNDTDEGRERNRRVELRILN